MVASAGASSHEASGTSSATAATRSPPKAGSSTAGPSTRMRMGGGGSGGSGGNGASGSSIGAAVASGGGGGGGGGGNGGAGAGNNGNGNGSNNGNGNGNGGLLAASAVNGSSNGIPASVQSVPFSSRRAQPLDMSTVEKRTVPAPRESRKILRPHNLVDAPVYYPTEEEFKDPFKFIQSIASEGRKYGIVKIIPPDSWNPPFSVDTERFHFRTRRQELNSVGGGTRANRNYLEQLQRYHAQHGTSLVRFPCVDKRPLDLYRLKKAVEIRGGFHKVCKLKKWAEIGRDLGYSGKIMSSLSTSLKNSYQRYLHPYEEYVKTAKPGVQQQLEAEYGGPFTPSPSASPAGKLSLKRTDSDLALSGDSLSKASNALNASVKDSSDSGKDTPMPDAPPTSSGFTAVNTSGGGFTPVNSGGSFTAVNGSRKPGDSDTPRSSGDFGSPDSAAKRNGVNGTPKSPIKEEEQNDDEPEHGERRSKRLKKAPTVAGSHMILHRPATPRITNDRPSKSQPGEKCETCGKGDDATSLLLCDGCDYGYHTYCLDPPVKSIPERDWYCNRCLVGTGEFGFEDGGVYSLKQFQEKANNFKDNYFKSRMPYDPVFNGRRPVGEEDVEREFWRLVESVHETVEVEYGADIHSTTHGSAFPTIERDPTNKYSHDPWNLNILPLHPESLFRHIKSDVSGMTVPWLYVGMCFSTFCWHNEDHYTYSANYQHFGATKTWYGIPGEDAIKFENAMKEAVPELFEQQPDLLFQLVTLLPPSALLKAGVKVYAVDQRAGQFVITFPQAYHAGFNHGFNFNEAVNFAPYDWEPYGLDGVKRYQEFRKQPVFSHDELLLTAAMRDTSIKTATWLAPALSKVRDREISDRTYIREQVPDIAEFLHEEDLPEDQYQCAVCKAYSYLSQVICNCTSNVACAAHLRDICDCPVEKLSLRLRYSDEQLIETISKVAEKANMPNVWAGKLEKLVVDNPRPPLKGLRSLLTEGERIPCDDIPKLAELKKFVERANEWVEEATNYISRKQQNRRKNEKAWRKGSSKAAELEERDREHRKVENIAKLLDEVELLAFDAPEIEQLRERADAIGEFQQRARAALSHPRGGGTFSVDYYEELIEAGRSFNVDLVETEELERIVAQLKWIDRAAEARQQYLFLQDVDELIVRGRELGISEHDKHMDYFHRQKVAGELWERKAKEVMSMEPIHFQQLEALSNQAASTTSVSRETHALVEQILHKQREAHRQVVSLFERTKADSIEQRPKYKDVREVIDSIAELHSKPKGTGDLEKEQKRHEDWMRRGKKLFGKANAPLHILLSHMQYVEARNSACFALEDRPRTPVEPASREPSADAAGEPETGSSRRDSTDGARGSKAREVFCICRQPEAGMMIECEVCHEWYHGKCLKIARGKVKEDEKYTCPICDYRVRIPRDAARPKLEDLMQWEDEIPSLPFIPDERDCLRRIIEVASAFRDSVKQYTHTTIGLTATEVPLMRFYLRKIEGAEVLLATETNFFRNELHRWVPIAPDPPPILSVSLSTRKPRPTKQQKLMMSLGIDNPDDLPQNLKMKPHTQKKKAQETTPNKIPAPIKPAPNKMDLTTSSAGTTPSQPQFDYSSRYSISAQTSPTFPSATSGQQSPVRNGMRNNGYEPVLFSTPATYPHGKPPRTSGSPQFATSAQGRDVDRLTSADSHGRPHDAVDVHMKDSSPTAAKAPQLDEASASIKAQQAAAEAATLKQFSTVDDDEKDADSKASAS